MSAAADVATGATLTGGTSGWTAQFTGIIPGGFTRESIETSHLALAAPSAGTFGNRTFIPGDLSDPGQIEIEGSYNPDDIPPIDAVAETWTIQYEASGGDSSGASLAGSGFMTDFNPTGAIEEKLGFTATIKFSGPITRTAGA